VAASKENFEEIKSLIEKLDQVGEDYLGDIHIINLDNLAAADIADKIEDLWERRSQLRADEGLPEDRPVIVTDARSNSLIIASNKEDFEAIKRVVSKLEAQKLSPMADIRIVKLEHNSASQVAETVETLFEERLEMSLSQDQEEPPSERIAIVDEPMTNSLLIASNKSNFEQVMDLVKKLDVLPDVEGVVRVFPIRHADVTKAAELIENMFEQNIYRGTAGDQDLPESEQEIAVVTDVRSSSLIISASPQNFAIVETLVNQIDQEDAPVFQAAARFFKLAHADVVSVASIMERLFEGMAAAAEEDDQYEITVIPDSRSNVLIVSGSRFAMRRAEELVQKLDREPGAPTSDMRVYMLDQASAATLEDIITEVFEERDEEQQDRTPVTVLADEGSNSLIVSASKEDHQVVTDLIAKLDKKSTLAQRMEVIKLQDAKAEQIADTLEDLIEQQQETEGTEVSFAITPEPRTNSLLVWAPPGMMTEIRTIVNTLDNTKSKAVMGLQVVKLYNSKAENMAELLDEFFEEAREGDEAEARQMIIKMIKGYDAQSHKPLFDKLVYQDVTIAADPNTNSLILMAPENNIDMMRTLVEMLDSVEPVVADIRPMPLYNANAEEMKDLLDELFQTERQGRGGEGEGRQQLVYGAGAAQALAAEGGAAIDLRFSVDMRTNTLIAAGSESYLDIVEEMVYKLDEREIEDRIQDVYRLQNAKATEVAQTMSDFFEQESELYETATEGEEAASRQLEREVSVHALEQEEGESSLLLLSYSPRMKSRIESMIAELDQPPPQVMIQVLMAEVTLDNNFEMGMEFALQDLLFSENAVVGPNDTLQGGDADFIAGTDVGAAGSGGLGGFSFSVTGEDFNFLLRALQSEGRLEVLSRPSIMVRDGDEADIQVGSEIPVVNDIAISGTGTVTPSVTYEEVGIGLNVTPIINPDGYVNMQINPEIDSVGESSVSIASGVSLPTFNNRTVETSVTVRDGETIIIGGLIKSTENDSENKVPLLGDIPILGNLFRAVNKEKSQTELLIVLTPKVIRTSADAREVSIEMRDQTGMMDETRHNPLMQGLQVKPHDDEFGPDQSELPIDTDIEDLDQPSADEQMGPAIEAQEFGPDVSTMNIHKGKRLAVQRAVAGRTSR
jgi:type II secretion system protein D